VPERWQTGHQGRVSWDTRDRSGRVTDWAPSCPNFQHWVNGRNAVRLDADSPRLIRLNSGCWMLRSYTPGSTASNGYTPASLVWALKRTPRMDTKLLFYCLGNPYGLEGYWAGEAAPCYLAIMKNRSLWRKEADSLQQCFILRFGGSSDSR
jgi:hypothetical protein